MDRPHRGGRLAVVSALLVALAACTAAPSGGSPEPSGTPSSPPSGSPIARPTNREPSSAPPVAQTPVPTAAATTYTVVPGDTLFAIATRFGTSVAQLQAWNAAAHPSLGDDPGTVRVGWVLVVASQPGVTPLPAPTAPPATPPPATAGCSAGGRVAAGGPQTFYAIPGAGSQVALTLDMGGRLDPAIEIMEFLVANQVCTTLFPTGVMSQTEVGSQVMAMVRAHPELFELGNHTMHHCDLASGGGGSPSTAPCVGGPPSGDVIARELTEAAAVLRELSGQDPAPYWRPPYGSINSGVISAAASAGYTKTFMWDIDTVDWKPAGQGGPTAEQIAANVIGNAGPGSVVLMHLGGYETLDALRIIVPALRERGLTPTSLSDMLG
jgi:peptidoglycan/xylan/chitin deacetylase (PgdA/CDA1 family)